MQSERDEMEYYGYKQKYVLLCKDCKHYERLMHLCRKFDEYGLAESDFCSRGERKDEI